MWLETAISNHKIGHSSTDNNTFSISYNFKLAPSPGETPDKFTTSVSRCFS